MSNQAMIQDAGGNTHVRVTTQPRIVSVVPSITELLFDLGLGECVVGRTGFCFYPKSQVKRIPKIGGTKDFDLEKLKALRPTHLIVNIDENPKALVDAASEFVPHIVVTHPMAPQDNVSLFQLLGDVFDQGENAARLVDRFQARWRELERIGDEFPQERVIYLIWKNPWMTICQDTYIARCLETIGYHHIPLDSSLRYPEVVLEDIVGDIDRILLSSEPYAFRQKDVDELRQQLGSKGAVTISLIDAEMTSWYGSRAIQGLEYLAQYRGGL